MTTKDLEWDCDQECMTETITFIFGERFNHNIQVIHLDYEGNILQDDDEEYFGQEWIITFNVYRPNTWNMMPVFSATKHAKKSI